MPVEFDNKDLTIYGSGLQAAVRIAEHEMFLSFNSYDQALAFAEWLTPQGLDAFKEWLKTYEPF
ncbi:MAG: hypothetical protein ACYTE8_00915 [Planctomycetota bacterium]|jgi:hypothetical protein